MQDELRKVLEIDLEGIVESEPNNLLLNMLDTLKCLLVSIPNSSSLSLCSLLVHRPFFIDTLVCSLNTSKLENYHYFIFEVLQKCIMYSEPVGMVKVLNSIMAIVPSTGVQQNKKEVEINSYYAELILMATGKIRKFINIFYKNKIKKKYFLFFS